MLTALISLCLHCALNTHIATLVLNVISYWQPTAFNHHVIYYYWAAVTVFHSIPKPRWDHTLLCCACAREETVPALQAYSLDKTGRRKEREQERWPGSLHFPGSNQHSSQDRITGASQFHIPHTGPRPLSDWGQVTQCLNQQQLIYLLRQGKNEKP